tara:strand:- start:2551 stop:2703 length:153 start_codon:yes stop_codon:yes gene_type:complete
MEKYINYSKTPVKKSSNMKSGGCSCGCVAQTISNHKDPILIKSKIKKTKK